MSARQFQTWNSTERNPSSKNLKEKKLNEQRKRRKKLGTCQHFTPHKSQAKEVKTNKSISTFCSRGLNNCLISWNELNSSLSKKFGEKTNVNNFFPKCCHRVKVRTLLSWASCFCWRWPPTWWLFQSFYFEERNSATASLPSSSSVWPWVTSPSRSSASSAPSLSRPVIFYGEVQRDRVK